MICSLGGGFRLESVMQAVKTSRQGLSAAQPRLSADAVSCQESPEACTLGHKFGLESALQATETLGCNVSAVQSAQSVDALSCPESPTSSWSMSVAQSVHSVDALSHQESPTSSWNLSAARSVRSWDAVSHKECSTACAFDDSGGLDTSRLVTLLAQLLNRSDGGEGEEEDAGSPHHGRSPEATNLGRGAPDVPVHRQKPEGDAEHGSEERQTRNLFYRTRLCAHFKAGRCRKGHLCHYAHCSEEVRAPPDLRWTKVCPVVAAGGTCTNSACTFAPTLQDLHRRGCSTPGSVVSAAL